MLGEIMRCAADFRGRESGRLNGAVGREENGMTFVFVDTLDDVVPHLFSDVTRPKPTKPPAHAVQAPIGYRRRGGSVGTESAAQSLRCART